jgi:hypothetical protein
VSPVLNDTTPHELRCLLNDNVNVQQQPDRVWYTQAHDSAERTVGFVNNNHGERGGGGIKGGRRTMSRPRPPCVHSRLVYGAHREYLANTLTFSPTYNQQTDTGSSVRQRLRTTTTNRQRRLPAEGSQEGERVG